MSDSLNASSTRVYRNSPPVVVTLIRILVTRHESQSRIHPSSRMAFSASRLTYRPDLIHTCITSFRHPWLPGICHTVYSSQFRLILRRAGSDAIVLLKYWYFIYKFAGKYLCWRLSFVRVAYYPQYISAYLQRRRIQCCVSYLLNTRTSRNCR